MFSYFNLLKNGNKGQIFPLLIAVVAILVIVALISANLGKVSLDRVNTMNAADAGALAGISDFTCAYNKAWLPNLIMLLIYTGIQTWLLLPQPKSACLKGIFACPACWFSRDSIARIVRDVNRTLYYTWRGQVRGYSESARKDAFYYALINAGIDDKFKWDGIGYRDKPLPGESWSQWQSYDSAFNKWIKDLQPNWDFHDINGNLLPGDRLDYPDVTTYLTYTWHNGSKSVTVAVTVPRADSSRLKLPLIGSYGLIIPPYVWLWWFSLPHGDPGDYFRVFVSLLPPSHRYARVKVERKNLTPAKDLGFWRARQPNTIISEAQADMTGETILTSSNNFTLRRIR